jgi:hypothetical protein
MNSDLEGVSGNTVSINPISGDNVDLQELNFLRKENKDLAEVVESLKEKLHAKTVEFNRANKKLQMAQKQPQQEEKKGTLLE